VQEQNVYHWILSNFSFDEGDKVSLASFIHPEKIKLKILINIHYFVLPGAHTQVRYNTTYVPPIEGGASRSALLQLYMRGSVPTTTERGLLERAAGQGTG
jgi:hypothetical protein